MSIKINHTSTTTIITQLQTWIVNPLTRLNQLFNTQTSAPIAVTPPATLQITVQPYGQTDSITIFKLQGKLNARSYKDLVTLAMSAYEQGSRRLLINLDEVSEITCSGEFALGNIARLYAAQPLIDPEAGWHALREMSQDWQLDDSPVKLFASQGKLETILAQTCLDQRLSIYNDMVEALKSFA